MGGTADAALRGNQARGFVQRWLLAPSHKDIGTLYLLFAIAAGLGGGALSVAMRMELQEPGMQIFASARTFDVIVTAHGLIMVFYVVMPAMLGGFGNWMVPLMTGAPGVAFPRLNALAFWLTPASFAALVVPLFVALPPAAAGGDGLAGAAALAALFLAGLSALLSAINFITTIFNMRAPGVTLARMPLFVWSVLITSFVMLLALPMLAAAITLMMTGAAFIPPPGADTAYYREVFWFLGHPEVYILILPGFGIVHHVVATFTGKPLPFHGGMAATMGAIGVLGFVVWAQHLDSFATAPVAGGQAYFLMAALVIALPAGVNITAWTAAMRGGGAAVSRTPMLWAAGFIFLFAIGAVMGVVGVARATLSGGAALKDTTFAVAQFHYMAGLSAVFALFAGWYYWFPRMTGYTFSEFLGRMHFWCTFVAVNVIFLPQHILGMAGMPRHAADYASEFAAWNYVSSLGTYLAAASLLVFLAAMAQAFAKRVLAGADPWGAGEAAREWASAATGRG